MRPFFRACNSVDGAIRLICRTGHKVAQFGQVLHSQPLQTGRIEGLARLLRLAKKRIARASRQLDQMQACSLLEPERGAFYVEACRDSVARQFGPMDKLLREVEAELARLRARVREGLESGELAAEPRAVRPRRRRIVLSPRPVPIRAFLALRASRVADRISPLLRRRRRIPGPASVRVPRRHLRGRAPPLPSTSAL